MDRRLLFLLASSLCGCAPDAIPKACADRTDLTTDAANALASIPEPANAHNACGVFLQGHGDMTGALAEYREANRLDPSNGAAQFNIAAVQYRSGHAEDAEPYARAFTDAYSGMPSGWILLGRIYQVEAIDPDKEARAAEFHALEREAYVRGCQVPIHLDDTSQIEMKASACNQLAILEIRHGHDEAAVDAFRDGLTASPKNAQLLRNREIFEERRSK